VAVLLALAGAVTWGTADYLGGVTTRRQPLLTVVAASQIAGLLLLAVASPVLGGSPTARHLALGGVGGLLGLGGFVLLYWSLANGKMSVVAPTTAVTSAAVPVLWGLGFGERLSALAVFGILMGLLAIALISRTNDSEERSLGTARSIPIALVSGALFGGFIVIFDNVGEDSGLWPLLSARVFSVSVLLIVVLMTRSALIPTSDRLPVASAGALDALANAFVLLAVQQGLLTLTAVLSSMYPAMTVALARAVDKERFQRVQIAGLIMAGVAIGCIAGG
jgi:drug/metabolite transporter (DMT)-like permease